MAYISADRLGSFPTTKRGSINKLVTENSLTRLINRLVDVTGYVITSEFDDNMVNYEDGVPASLWNVPLADFEFTLRGYYFCISADDSKSGLQYLISSTSFVTVSGETNKLTAHIFIDKTNSDYPELWGQDSVENSDVLCRAVQFTRIGEQPEFPEDYSTGNYEHYSLDVVQWKQMLNGSWGFSIPVESVFKFHSKSIRDIDGGEIVL